MEKKYIHQRVFPVYFSLVDNIVKPIEWDKGHDKDGRTKRERKRETHRDPAES